MKPTQDAEIAIRDQIQKAHFIAQLNSCLKDTDPYDIFMIHPHEDLLAQAYGHTLLHLDGRHALFFSSVAAELDRYPFRDHVPNLVILNEEFLRARWKQIIERLIAGDSLRHALMNACKDWR